MAQVKLKLHDKRFVRTLHATAKAAVTKSTKLANKRFIKHISLRCHSLKQLAEMGHPYAARHGGHGMAIHDPWWQIHKQTGGLISDSVQEVRIMVTDDSVVGNYGFEPDELPIMLVGGTSKMIPRPVISGTLIEIKETVRKIIVDAFKARYGSNLNVGVSFDG